MRKSLLLFCFSLLLLHLPVHAQPSREKYCISDGDNRRTGEIFPGQSDPLSLLECARVFADTLPELTIKCLIRGLRIASEKGDFKAKGELYFSLGHYMARNGNFLDAQEMLIRAESNFSHAGDSTGLFSTLLGIGILNRSLRNYKTAGEYFENALKLAFILRNLNFQGQALHNLGALHQASGDRARSDIYYRQALACFRSVKNKQEEISVLNNQGSQLLDQEKFDEAILFYTNLLSAKESDKEILGVIYTRIAHAWDQKKNFIKSLEYNKLALQTRISDHNIFDLNSSLINIGGDFVNLGNADSAIFYLSKGMIKAQKCRQNNLLANGCRHFERLFLKQGNFGNALVFKVREGLYRSNLENERSRSHMGILQANLLLRSKEAAKQRLIREENIQQLQLKYNQYMLFISGIIALIAGAGAIVLSLIYLFNRKAGVKVQVLHANLIRESRERAAKEMQTRQEEQRFRFLSENSLDFITLIDASMKRVYASPSSKELYGYTSQEMLSISPYNITHPDFHAEAEKLFLIMKETRKPQQLVCKAVKRDGTTFWIESLFNPLFDPQSGDFKGLVGVTRDIQERKTKEFDIMESTRQKENLLKEIHHRVKNNFAILISLINMQLAKVNDTELSKPLTNLQLRIRSMALVHEMLYRSEDFEKISFPDYLRTLASVISGTFNRRDVTLEVEAENAVISIDTAIPLGLTINEILTNAYAHAFPGGRSGIIRVNFRKEEEPLRYSLRISDNGIGFPKDFDPVKVNTMGLQIVQLLCRQMEADLSISGEQGTIFSFTFHSHFC